MPDTVVPDPVTSRPSATSWLAEMAAGTISARELVTQTLARIAAADQLVHAVVSQDDGAALAAADSADAARRDGVVLPLLGLPVTIKDALDLAGLPTTSGTYARHGAPAASRDATVVARLRAAGAIPLLKTNVPELCSAYETDNVVHGLTRNPLALDRTPGGSSGGEAALLGADASIVGIGTDGGGSIRVPSHYVGTVGLRPTTGRVPETGFWPETRSTGMRDLSCVGPMARHVEDLGLLLAVIAGSDGHDSHVTDHPLLAWRAVDVSRLRVAWYDTHHAATPATDGTRRAVELAAATLRRAGCVVTRIDAPARGRRAATELFFAATSTDGGQQFRRDVAAAEGRHHWNFQGLLDHESAPLGPRELAELFAEIDDYRAAVRHELSAFDVVVSPVVSGPAPLHGQPPAGGAPDDYFAYRAFEFVHIVAMAGLPAASVPVSTEDGLPVGVQIIGSAWREDVVLAAAAHLERELGGFQINRTLSAAAHH